MQNPQSPNKILIIGAGGMARAVALDLRLCEPKYELTVVDRSDERLRAMTSENALTGLAVHRVDAADPEAVKPLMEGADLCFGCADYGLNAHLARLAVECVTHWVDLGGNNDVVAAQFELHAEALRSDVAVMPDCGLAPGMVNVIGADAVSRLDTVEELRLRVGGLPLTPEPPLNYRLCFSPRGLINEYVEPARVIEDGVVREVESLTGWERVDTGPPHGMLEAFHTSGGSSTMIDSFGARVRNLDYKTIRYPGHLWRVKLLRDLGLFDSRPVQTADGDVAPRAALEAVLDRLGWMTEDLVIVRCWAVGTHAGGKKRIDYRLIDHYDAKNGITAMARTTGFSVAIVARMILDGRIPERGVLRQERCVPPAAFFNEMERRGLRMEISESRL